MKIADIKAGQKFYTVDDEGVIRNFTITLITDKKVTVHNDAGYAHRINVRTRYCRVFSHRQAQESIDTNFWILK